ncbi:uncharacterized protein LOC105939427 [Fundulus heteroclitus]|uniref:uncharacterized protein LOC105939427 n=1 Tax=Fundulus heteroclitus TaxID=8078 RepID=UPI00165C3399|nr:uncharacterized protein LOC105939427 [Fundulus heteroclitus]
MLFLKAELMLLGFILSISVALGKERSICVLKGSSVNLTCFAEDSSTSKTWYTVNNNNNVFGLKELSANADVTYNIMEDDTLTIRDVKKSDAYGYCCQEPGSKPELCWENRTELHVADLQVKVFPATEGHKLSLMCSASCPLTESPAAFIWYKNQRSLYEDWSPWYRELVSSDPAVRYSCAVKDYEDLRAPEVSVASITSDCFGVTYTKGEACPKKLKSPDEPCSIMYPRELHIEMNPEREYRTLTCRTSCPAADSDTAFRWYWNRRVFMDCTSQDISVFTFFSYMSCAVENNEYLHSDEFCSDSDVCIYINYGSSRLCMLEGSSVNISSKYSNSRFFTSEHESWYKLRRSTKKEADVTSIEAGGRVQLHKINNNQRILCINDLRKNDSGEYIFTHYKNEKHEQPDLLGVILVVTGLKVTMSPSDVVTEGQRVTLTCSTSCPLAEDTTYVWFFNEEPISLSGKHNQHLVLNPVSTLHAGNYSCAVRSSQNISSALETLTVKAGRSVAIMNIVKMVFLSIILLVGCKLYLMLRKRKTATPAAKQSENAGTEEITAHNERITLMARKPRAEREQEQQQQDTV